MDKKYIQLCLELAKKGVGKVSPNPLVGCVIVKNNRIVGQGYHEYFGGPHAEIEALRNAGPKTKGATLYINLEPCCHWGKTPPCTDAIIDAGIKQVVVSMKDPNPLVNGKGIKQLKVKGVKCKVGILEEEAKELNRAYIKFVTKKMPYVILKTAMSLDGKIATRRGESKWITSTEAREYVHSLRSQVDAVLVGINTVLKDNPTLTTHSKGHNPLRIILDPYLSIPRNAEVLDDQAETLLVISETITQSEQNRKKIKILENSGIKILASPEEDGKFDFREIMRQLADMNITSVLIEGGGGTNAYALEAGIVDEIMFFIAPKIIGGKNAPTPVEGEGIKTLSEALRIKDLSIEKIGEDFLLKGKILSA